MGSYVLITGRTAKQGVALHTGKTSKDYHDAVATASMNENDMKKDGLKEGDVAKLTTLSGKVVVKVSKGNVPEGMVFMPYGPWANLLISSSTHGVGMPDFKGISVDISRSDEEPWSWKRVLQEVRKNED